MSRVGSVALLAALLIVFFGPSILPSAGEFAGGTDVSRYFLWNAQFVKERFLAGSLPLWNPHYYSGHPFLANPQTFVFYPATVLFVLLPLPWAFSIDTFLHFLLAALGACWLVREITRSTWGGVAAGIVFGFSGYFVERLGAGHLTALHTAAWMPWVFLFLQRGYATARRKEFVLAGAVWSLQILGGEPQTCFYTGLALGSYAVLYRILTPRDERLRPLRRWVALHTLIPLVAAGIAAVQILPAIEFARLSDRAAETYEFATQMSFPARNFYTLLVPRPQTELLGANWEYATYVGVLSLLLAVVGAVRSRDRRPACCFAALAVLGALCMLGRHTPAYRLLYHVVPGFSLFRVPARCSVMLTLALSVLAGLGTHQFLRGTLDPRLRRLLPLLGAGFVACILAGGRALRVGLFSPGIVQAVALTGAAVIVLGLPRGAKTRAIVTAVFFALLFADPYLNHADRLPRVDAQKVLRETEWDREVSRDPGVYRVAMPADAVRGVAFLHSDVNGYTPLVLARYLAFMYEMSGLSVPVTGNHTLHRSMFVRERVFRSKVLGIKYALVRDPDGLLWVRSTWFMPRAALVPRAVIEPSPEAQLRLLKRPDFDPERTVLLAAPLAATPGTASVGAGEARPAGGEGVEIVEYEPNRIALRAETASPAYLLLSELDYPGWRAYIGSREVPIARADYLLRAIALPAGRHEVAFVYRPWSFRLGAALSLVTLLALLAGAVLTRPKGRCGRPAGVVPPQSRKAHS